MTAKGRPVVLGLPTPPRVPRVMVDAAITHVQAALDRVRRTSDADADLRPPVDQLKELVTLLDRVVFAIELSDQGHPTRTGRTR